MKLLRIGKLVLLLALILLIQHSHVIAQDESKQEISIVAEAGFDGLYKAEYWVPVNVTIANSGLDVDGLLQVVVGSGPADDEVLYTSPIQLPNGSNKQHTFFVYLPGYTGNITVHLVDEEGQPLGAATTDPLTLLALEDLNYGVVTTDPAEFNILEQFEGSRSIAAVAYLSLEDLPEVASAWNSLDVLIFHNVDTGQLTSAQLAAMRAWLEVGGQIVVSGGAGWQKAAAGLSSLLPVTILGNETWQDLPALREEADKPFRDPGSYLVTKNLLVTGEALILENGVPLLARREYGRGAVYFLALDPALPPMADWDGSALIWSQIAQSVPDWPMWAIGATNSYAAANAASSLPSLTLPSGFQLFLYLLLYIVIIGPVNYLVLNRKNRRELAWLTVPALVIIFSGIAYLVGFRLKGNETILNQLSIAYGHIDSEQVRVQSLFGLYSPSRDTYDLTLPGKANARPFSQAYGALSGSGNIEAIERGNDLYVRGIRVDVSDVETLVADSYQPGPALSANVEMKMIDTEFVADVSIQNNGDEAFENVTLLLGTLAIPVGDLRPGESRSLTEEVSFILSSPAFGGLSAGFPPTGPSTSPIASSYGTILGTTNYFNEPDVYPRWQLLDSIVPELGSPYSGSAIPGSVTLVAWSDEEQLAALLDNEAIESAATSLYFLEVPIKQSALDGENVLIPKALFDWRVMDDSGFYNPGISDYYFSPGWIEYEFTPWLQFRAMSVGNLAVVVQTNSSPTHQPIPQIKIWNWSAKRWDMIDDPQWGPNRVSDHESYLGPENSVRLRLENATSQGINLQELYLELTGDLGS